MANVKYLPKMIAINSPIGELYHDVVGKEHIFIIAYKYYKNPGSFELIAYKNQDILCDENGTPDIYHLPERLAI